MRLASSQVERSWCSSIASFFLSRDCGDAAGSDASFILVYVAPALAIGTVGSFKDKAPSTSAWIGLLIAVPLLARFSLTGKHFREQRRRVRRILGASMPVLTCVGRE